MNLFGPSRATAMPGRPGQPFGFSAPARAFWRLDVDAMLSRTTVFCQSQGIRRFP